MTGILVVTDEDEKKEERDVHVMTEEVVIHVMTEEVVIHVMIEVATDEIEATTVAKKRHTHETIGIVANVETQTSHSEPNVIDVVLQKAAKAGVILGNGVATIEDLVIETTTHSQDLEIGNVANAKK